MSKVKDQTAPEGAWKFDDEVTNAFEDMLERSIPLYDLMRDLTTELAAGFLPDAAGGVAVDLGASRGDGLALLKKVRRQAQFHAVEVSEPMLAALEERWPQDHSRIPEHGVYVHDHDLRKGYPPTGQAHVTLCVLTLQFTPIEHRQRILRDIWTRTYPGGALLLVEKVLGSTADMDEQLVRHYYAMKRENGYSDEQIERKRLSLEGVLVPVTAAWNEDLLRQAGFGEVDCYWRCLNFAAWLAVKERRY
jgi:tRNA (cmo5U34)-methyltransferase